MSRRNGTASRLVLKWLWDQHDTIQDPADAPLIGIMTELVISENKETLIWDWTRDKEPTNPTLPDEICLAWRKLAFGALIRAKAKNMRRSLDGSLKVFFGMVEPGSCHVPLSASAISLMVQLSSPLPVCLAPSVSQSPSSMTTSSLEKPPTKLVRLPKTSLDLGKRFHDGLGSKGAKLGSHYAELHQSYMWLFPRQTQKADPYPALGMLKGIHGNPMYPMRRIMKRDAIVRHAQQFSLCADLLDSMGDKEQAWWTRKVNRELFFKAATKFTFSAAQIYHEEPGKVVHGTSADKSARDYWEGHMSIESQQLNRKQQKRRDYEPSAGQFALRQLPNRVADPKRYSESVKIARFSVVVPLMLRSSCLCPSNYDTSCFRCEGVMNEALGS